MNKITWSIILTVVLFFSRTEAASSLHLLTLADGSREPSAAGSADSYAGIITPDGRYVLFTSAAENLYLTTNNTAAFSPFPGRLNVFLRDRTNGITSLISINVDGTGGGDHDSIAKGISADGRFALFESRASNLVAGDTNDVTDIFIRDLVNELTICVSISATGGNANGASSQAVLTPDGRFVAFTSAASNLVADDTNGIPDVFVRDLELNTTALVSDGAVPVSVSSISQDPQISDDGRYVAFHSTATNLVPDVETYGEVYLRDLVAGTTFFASTNARAELDAALPNTNAVSFNHVISSDGRFVAFQVRRSHGEFYPAIVLRYDRTTGLTDLIHTNAYTPNMSAVEIRNMSLTPDGRFLAFVANAEGIVGTNTCIQVWDADTDTTTLASGNADGEVPPASTCDWPSIDPSGRFVTFVSSAPGLVTNSLSGLYHVYVRDLLLNTTTLVNVDTNSIGSEVLCAGISQMTENGRYVLFESFDGAFVAGDQNRAFDVFLRDVVDGTTELISARHQELPSLSGTGVSTISPWSVSWSGRYVAFSSAAEDLVANDANANRDVFVRDMLEGTTTLVSVNTNGISASGTSLDPSISGDGRYVAFTSTASDLASKDTNKIWDIFLRDLQFPNVVLASVATTGNSGADNDCYAPQLSADAKYLLFRSKASNLATIQSGTNLFLRNLESSTTVALTTLGVVDASMTQDGKFVAFLGNVGSGNRLYVWSSDTSARIYTNVNLDIASVAAISPQGDHLAYIQNNRLNTLNWRTGSNWLAGFVSNYIENGIRFSGDGRFLTFAAANPQFLVSDNNSTFDTFLFDLQTGTKTHISKRHDALAAGNAASQHPVISYDGRFVAYRSAASDLVPGITNLWPNIFLYDRLAGTNRLLSMNRWSNSGGNQWCFAPALSGDGRFLVFPSFASDLNANDLDRGVDLFGFTFLYATVTLGTNGEGPTITWPVMPGENYQVQFKDNVDDSIWQNLNGEVVVVGTQASIRDESPAANQRIYRVVSF